VALILEHFRYRLCGHEERLGLEQRAMSAARISTRPVFVLRELVDSMRLNRIVLPGYTYLQDVVRRALAFERHRLSGALIQLIAVDDIQLLDRLLEDVSPLAWQHINFYGRYQQFNSDTPLVNTTEIAKKLAALQHSGLQKMDIR